MDYVGLLKDYNLKVTPQRLDIVDILYKKGHVNIDDLFLSLKNRFPSLSLATVYKNIKIMCDKLFLSEVKIPNQKNVYELTKKEHSHVICTKCETIMDIELDTSSLLNKAKEISDFTLTKSSIILNGLCPQCIN